MNDRIRSRKALLDIGAAGPIAGMLVAVPVLCWGLKLSVGRRRAAPGHYVQEGQSILYWLMKRIAVLDPSPPIRTYNSTRWHLPVGAACFSP